MPAPSTAACVLHGTARTLHDADSGRVTASLAKTGILAALLLQAQDGSRLPPAETLATAEAMITTSDNTAASELWRAIGGAEGFDTAARRFGLQSTEAGRDGYWGLTRTTARDQLVLLQALFAHSPGPGTGSPGSGHVLDARARAVAHRLLGGVVASQDWGISAAGTAAQLKNGWLPRTGTGLWVVNSAGAVTVGGRRLLVAVLSDGHPSMGCGVRAVERAACLAAHRLTR